ncbi:DinB family protein [Paenibacillus sp. YPG26]|uniref:DinB family protein n=1 Tax=Paenibacillus sp. YPG26 TaxID=2878915 RepID=UPI00203BB2B4|nr:DinB family protein [Paenibacillus sp. YPG26]USB31692.1 DinB family protein [Paenibacillus sp. YPG26]
MDHYLFDQLKFVRGATINQVKAMSEDEARTVPRGLNNNILWNLGHILLVHEKFSTVITNEKVELPLHFTEMFAPGTKPDNWGTQVPDLEEILLLLSQQIERIEQTLGNRLDEEIRPPKVTSSGLKISTVKECLSFCLYHEGMHFAAIKAIKQLL